MAEEKRTEQVKGRYEMLWDCSYCGKSKLLALTHRHCPECGGAQDQTKRYFPAEGEKVAVKDDYAGTDRKCESCGQANGSKATFCAGCGAPLDEAAAVKVRADRVAKDPKAFEADDAKKAAAELGPGAKPKVAAVKKRSWVWLYILIFAVAVIGSIWFFCIRAKTAEFEVAERRWKKQIPIEEKRDVEKQAWKHELPGGADVVSCRDETYETKKVDSGKKDCQTRQVDKGDGTMEEIEECKPIMESESVKRPKCTYRVKEWVVVETREEVATDGDEPDWPDSVETTGYRRAGDKKEVFEVDLVRGGDTTTCAVKRSVWDQLFKGTGAKGKVRGAQETVDCSSIEPN